VRGNCRRNREGTVCLYEDVSPSLSLSLIAADTKEGDMQCTKYGRTTRETGNEKRWRSSTQVQLAG
jgi:hypothetical protein